MIVLGFYNFVLKQFRKSFLSLQKKNMWFGFCFGIEVSFRFMARSVLQIIDHAKVHRDPLELINLNFKVFI